MVEGFTLARIPAALRLAPRYLPASRGPHRGRVFLILTKDLLRRGIFREALSGKIFLVSRRTPIMSRAILRKNRIRPIMGGHEGQNLRKFRRARPIPSPAAASILGMSTLDAGEVLRAVREGDSGGHLDR